MKKTSDIPQDIQNYSVEQLENLLKRFDGRYRDKITEVKQILKEKKTQNDEILLRKQQQVYEKAQQKQKAFEENQKKYQKEVHQRLINQTKRLLDVEENKKQKERTDNTISKALQSLQNTDQGVLAKTIQKEKEAKDAKYERYVNDYIENLGTFNMSTKEQFNKNEDRIEKNLEDMAMGVKDTHQPSFKYEAIEKLEQEEFFKLFDQLPKDEVDQHIKETNSFHVKDRFEMEFFHRYADRILKQHIGEWLIVENQMGQEQLIKVDEKRIKEINEYIYSRLNGATANNSDPIINRAIYESFSARFIKPTTYKKLEEKGFLENKLHDVPNDDRTEVFYGLVPQSRQYTRKRGAYFNYINLIPEIDLSRYQIGRTEEEHMQINNKHCLLYAFEQTGLLTEQQLNNISYQMTSTSKFSLDQIKKLENLPATCIVSRKENDDKNQYIYIVDNKTFTLKPKDIEFIYIACYKEHYFLYEIQKVSSLFIKHYEKYHDDIRYKNYLDLGRANIKNEKAYFEHKKQGTNTTTSLELIYQMDQLKYFKQITTVNEHNREILLTEAPEAFDTKKTEYEMRDIDYKEVFYGNFMTYNNTGKLQNGRLERIIQKEFLFSFISNNKQDDTMINGRNIYCFMNHLKEKYFNIEENINVLIYLHDLARVQSCFILNKSFTVSNILKKDQNFMCFVIRLKTDSGKTIIVKFQDSKRMIDMDYQKMIELNKLDTKVLDINLDYINEERYMNNDLNISKFYQFNKNRYDYKTFKKFFKNHTLESFCEEQNRNIIMTLKKSMRRFRRQISEEFDLDIFQFLSIQQLSNNFQKLQGVFDGCVKARKAQREYLHQFISGGKNMMKNNEMQHVTGNIQYLDANALYPTAQSMICYPTGEAKPLTEEMIQKYNNKDELFKISTGINSEDQKTIHVTVRCFNCKRQSGFPVLQDKKTKLYMNDLDDVFYLDFIELQDAVRLQGYDYEILSGLYYEGRNDKIQEVIKAQYQKRLDYKNTEIEPTYKLMLSSSSGNTCQHPILTKTVQKTFEEFLKLSVDKFNNIDSVIKLNDQYFMTIKDEIDNCGVYYQIGSLILSMARRIMNNLIYLCEDLGINVMYIDTDGIQLEIDKIETLKEEYEKLYGIQLIGTQLGQFKYDFKSKKGKVNKCVEAFYVAKKVYGCKLELVNGDVDYHYRLCTVTHEAIKEVIEKNYRIEPLELYNDLYQHEAIKFDLLAGNKERLLKKQMQVQNKDFYMKTVQYL